MRETSTLISSIDFEVTLHNDLECPGGSPVYSSIACIAKRPSPLRYQVVRSPGNLMSEGFGAKKVPLSCLNCGDGVKQANEGISFDDSYIHRPTDQSDRRNLLADS